MSSSRKALIIFGLFAIVYATELAHRGDPVKVVYSQGEMRSHFIVYMENGTLTPFPFHFGASEVREANSTDIGHHLA